MQDKLDDQQITKNVEKILRKKRGKTHRVSARTEAMIQTALTRIKQIEEQEDEKMKTFRKSGAGLNAASLINWALREALESNLPPLNREHDLEDREMLEGERGAVPEWIEQPTDAQIIKRRAENMVKQAENNIAEEKEFLEEKA